MHLSLPSFVDKVLARVLPRHYLIPFFAISVTHKVSCLLLQYSVGLNAGPSPASRHLLMFWVSQRLPHVRQFQSMNTF